MMTSIMTMADTHSCSHGTTWTQPNPENKDMLGYLFHWSVVEDIVQLENLVNLWRKIIMKLNSPNIQPENKWPLKYVCLHVCYDAVPGLQGIYLCSPREHDIGLSLGRRFMSLTRVWGALWTCSKTISLQSWEKVHTGGEGEACISLKMALPRLLDTSLDYKLCHPPNICHSDHAIVCSRTESPNLQFLKFKVECFASQFLLWMSNKMTLLMYC